MTRAHKKILVLREYVRLTLEASIAKKEGGRPKGTFYGNDEGAWNYTEGYPLGLRKQGWTWQASIALASQNGWRNLMVDGATEQHQGFREALTKIVEAYPEVRDYIISFDGPFMSVSELVEQEQKTDWSAMVFYHGTSDDALDAIMAQGLRPRSETNVEPAYGVEFGAASGKQEAVYLTTQIGMAHSAAHSAARQRKGKPVILRVQGIDGSLVAPDEDSRETDPRKSLERMGSIAYLGRIVPEMIDVHARWDDGWVTE